MNKKTKQEYFIKKLMASVEEQLPPLNEDYETYEEFVQYFVDLIVGMEIMVASNFDFYNHLREANPYPSPEGEKILKKVKRLTFISQKNLEETRIIFRTMLKDERVKKDFQN